MAEPIVGSPAYQAQTQAFIDSVPSVIEGSQAAEDALHAIVKPLVGAQDAPAMTTAQLNVKWSAVDPTGVIQDSAFPTAQ